ncbi:MAG: Hpt domain-containing protein [Bacteroidota bacterium]
MKTTEQGTYFNLNYLNQISGGDEVFVSELTKTFLTQTPEMVHELEYAINQNDHGKVQFLAHRLKTSCEIMGMMFASAICLLLETAAHQKQDLSGLKSEASKLIHQLSVSTRELTGVAA